MPIRESSQAIKEVILLMETSASFFKFISTPLS